MRIARRSYVPAYSMKGDKMNKLLRFTLYALRVAFTLSAVGFMWGLALSFVWAWPFAIAITLAAIVSLFVRLVK